MLSFTFTTSSSLPAFFFKLDPTLFELFLLFFTSMRLLKTFFVVLPFWSIGIPVGSTSIVAWRRALRAARAVKRRAEEVSETVGEGGDSFSREKVTERVFFFPFCSPSLPLEVLRGMGSWLGSWMLMNRFLSYSNTERVFRMKLVMQLCAQQSWHFLMEWKQLWKWDQSSIFKMCSATQESIFGLLLEDKKYFGILDYNGRLKFASSAHWRQGTGARHVHGFKRWKPVVIVGSPGISATKPIEQNQLTSASSPEFEGDVFLDLNDLLVEGAMFTIGCIWKGRFEW